MKRSTLVIEPRAAADRILDRWYLLLLAGLAGGLAGLIFSVVRAPVFEADAVVAINIDYGRTEPLELIVEDRALDRVWQFLTSDQILTAASEKLSAQSASSTAWESPESMREYVRLEARLSDWHFIARNEDPETAAMIANAWAEAGIEGLDEAYAHAWTAFSLQNGQLDVFCFEQSQPLTPDSIANCLASGPNVDSEKLESLIGEIAASHGILPSLSYELMRSATPPDSPVVWNRGALVISGAVIGLLIAGVVLALYPKSGNREPEVETAGVDEETS
ncbi:MAG: hypothetical protein BMS9Abin28_1665 [Anaerolineae bacterium]|nr:MAG: hypothetical protein BMS9Abin28_1665 [Anaerolineae bacterium]